MTQPTELTELEEDRRLIDILKVLQEDPPLFDTLAQTLAWAEQRLIYHILRNIWRGSNRRLSAVDQALLTIKTLGWQQERSQANIQTAYDQLVAEIEAEDRWVYWLDVGQGQILMCQEGRRESTTQVVYDGLADRYTPYEAMAFVELLNEGHDKMDYADLDRLIVERAKQIEEREEGEPSHE